MKILIADKSSPACAALLREAGHEIDELTGLSPEELKSRIAPYHGLIIRSATRVTADLLAAADKLQLVGRAGTGVDNVDLAAASSRGIKVMNTPGGNSNAVAEMVLGQMLSLARSLFNATASMKEGRWDKKLFKGGELEGKTLGLLGYGRVSRLLAGKCRLLGMETVCFDPKISKDIIDADGLQIMASLKELLASADYLSVHLSKREDTRDFINTAQFADLKTGCYLINFSRGGIVNEDALFQALEKSTVAGAAIDVFVEEPPADRRLIEHRNVISTPHIGAASEESQEKVAVMIAEQFADFFAGKPARNVVNKA